MHVITKRRLQTFWAHHPKAKMPMTAWFKAVSAAKWTGPADVKETFGTSVDFVGDNRIICNIGGNKYRIVAHIAYQFGKVLIKFVGTHKEYDDINAEKVS